MRAPRAGYTLIEIVCVLALMIIIAGIATPVMFSMLTDSRVASAGDQVRGQLAETRARAMEDGKPWRLAFIANTGVFQLAPEDSTEWDGAAQEPAWKADLIRDALPAEVVFALKHEDIFSSLDGQKGSAGSDWETIAIYMPDGSARDDTVTYFGRPGFAPMRAKVRGMTGAVDIENFKAAMADQK